MTAIPPIYETITNTLMATIQAACGDIFSHYSRRLLMWEEMVQVIKDGVIRPPVLFLFDGVGLGGGRINFEPRGRGNPGVRIMNRTIVVYAVLPGGFTPEGPDSTTAAGSVFAPLQEAIEGAFAADSEGALTLGGLVSHCWIKGDAMWITGEIDPNGLGMLTVPVEIMLP